MNQVLRALGILLVVCAQVWAGEVSLICHRGGVPVEGVPITIGGLKAVSDAEGVVRFPHVPKGRHPVSAHFGAAAPGRFGGIMGAGEIVVKGSLIGKRIELPGPVTLRGRVVDGSTGKPLANAVVEVSTAQGQAVIKVVAGDAGKFRIPDLAPTMLRVRASKQGFEPDESWMRIGSSGVLELAPVPVGKKALPTIRLNVLRGSGFAKGLSVELTLANNEVVVLADGGSGVLRVPLTMMGQAVVRIVVRDTDGWKAVVKPRAGSATVGLNGLALAGVVRTADAAPVAAVPVLARKGDRIVTAWTNGKGEFELAGLDLGMWHLEVFDSRLRSAQPVPVQVKDVNAPVKLIATPTITLRGRVTGIADGEIATVIVGRRRTTTDASGAFEISGVPARKQLFVQARVSGYLAATKLVAGDQPIEFAMSRAGVVEGVVLDDTGGPVVGAQIVIGDPGRGIPRRQGSTGSEGRFKIGNVRSGVKLRARVIAAGFAPGVSPEFVVGEAQPGTIRLERGVVLSGKVVDENGAAVVGVALTVRSDRMPWPRPISPTDKTGAFSADGLAPGAVTLGLSPAAAEWEQTRVAAKAPGSGVVVRLRKRKLADIAAGEGIAWTGDVKATFARAEKDNMPVVVAINALDNEGGNRTMAFVRYRDPALIAASGAALCLVASPSDHPHKSGICARFGSCKCADHKGVLNWAMLRFAPDRNLVSPQHMILAPDGKVLFRREFWIDAEDLQREIEKAVVKVAPLRALMLARGTRRAKLAEMKEAGSDPTAYLKSGDPLATAVLLLLYEDDESDRWLEALKSAPRDAFGLLRLFLEDDKKFVPVALKVDPKRGRWWQRFHSDSKAKVPLPADKKLAVAVQRLRGGDKTVLGALLAALDHPLNGPEVRACLAQLAGRDHGNDIDAWKEELSK